MDKSVQITTLTNPLSRDPLVCQVRPGKTITQLFGKKIDPQFEIDINGDPLPRKHYGNYRLKEKDIVVIRRFPAGGQSQTAKDIERVAALIAITVASYGAGDALAGTLGLVNSAGQLTLGGSLIASSVATAITFAGSAALNALIPVPNIKNSTTDKSSQFNRLGALTGASNQMTPYAVVPRVYGQRKFFPPMSAQPYTEVVANQQYLRLLFCLGPGPLLLSNPKIGDTLIGSFDAANGFTSNGNYEDVEIEVGENPSLYSKDVNEVNPGVSLNNASDSAIRTTVAGCDEVSLDFTFPGGLFQVDSAGDILSAQVDFLIEYRPTGGSTWTPALGTKGTSTCSGGLNKRITVRGVESDCATLTTGDPVLFEASSGAKETYRAGIKMQLPSNGQYDIRVTRQTAAGGSTVADACTWTSFRSITYQSPVDMPGVVQLAMRIKATDQLNGILDNFSVVGQSRLSYYDGAAWQDPVLNSATGEGTGGELTANPAWILADILCGSANARAIDHTRINASAFKTWADWCTTNSFTYNNIIDSQTTVAELAKAVAAAGRASFGLQDGLYTAIQDLTGMSPVQMFTPRNSWGFKSTKTFLLQPHALKVQFANEASDWKTEENYIYNDGYSADGTSCLFGDGTGICKTATRFETMNLDGVTNWDQAWQLGRYRLAEARLRPEIYTIMADIENIVCQRGDLVKVAHDVSLWGSRWGRIKTVTRDGSNNVTSLTLDEPASMTTGKTYQIRIRQDDDAFQVLDINTVTGDQTTITLTTPAIYDGINPGDLFAFGEQNLETVSLKVVGIEPQSDLSAKITLVDEAPGIASAVSATIPTFNPQITNPLDLNDITPPDPVIDSIRSDMNSLYKDDDGSYHLRLLVSFSVPSVLPTMSVQARYRANDSLSGWSELINADANLGVVSLPNVTRGKDYIIQIRTVYKNKTSSWVEYSSAHTVAGKDSPPSDVTGFTASIDKTQVLLSWDGISDTDLWYYEIRKGADWASGTLVDKINAKQKHDAISASGSVTYWIKAVDSAGQPSTNAASASITIASKYTVDPVYPSTGDAAYLQIANNLSDLSNIATARANLGLGSLDIPTFAGLTLTGGLTATTGNFSGDVSMAGLTATTGTFGGLVQIQRSSEEQLRMGGTVASPYWSMYDSTNTRQVYFQVVEGTGARTLIDSENTPLHFLAPSTNVYLGSGHVTINNGTTDLGYPLGVSGDIYGSGNLLIGNTTIHPASGFVSQLGLGFDSSIGRLEVSSNNDTTLELGRFGGAGSLLTFRYASVNLNNINTDGSYIYFSNSIGIGASPQVGYKLDVNGPSVLRTSVASYPAVYAIASGTTGNQFAVYGLSDGVNTGTNYGGYFHASGGATNYSIYSASGDISIAAGGNIGTNNYVSGSTGWRITYAGAIDLASTLNVTGAGMFSSTLDVATSVSNDTSAFTTGFLGSGWKTYQTSSEWTLETDVGFFRSALFAQEFIINQIVAEQGSVIQSPGRGKVESVTTSTVGSEVVKVSDPAGDAYSSFVAGDIILCLRVRSDLVTSTTNVLTDTGGVIVKRYVRKVSSVTGNSVTFTSATGAPTDAGVVAKGDIIVVVANTTDSTRQAMIYSTVIEPNSPYVVMKTGLDSWSAFKSAFNERFKYGQLDQSYGYTSSTFGVAMGDPSAEHLTIDDTNGIRFFASDGSTVTAQLSGSSFQLLDVSGYANISDKPTSLSGINSTEGTKLSGIESGADVTSTHTSNDTSNVNGTASTSISAWSGYANAGLDSSGNIKRIISSANIASGSTTNNALNMTGTYLGYKDSGGTWRSFIKNDGSFAFQNNSGYGISLSATTASFVANLNSFTLTAGSDYWRTSDKKGSLGGVFTWDGVAATGTMAGWTANATAIYATHSTFNTEINSYANSTNSSIRLYDSSSKIMVGMGLGYWAGAWQNAFGLWLTDDFTTHNPYMQFTVTSGTLTAQIAGWNFDTGKLYGSYSSVYTGIQTPTAATTKTFFTGATDNVGTSAKAYFTADGHLYYSGIGTIIYASTSSAAYNTDNATATNTLTEYWYAYTTASSAITNSSGFKTVLYTTFLKRYGENNIIIQFNGNMTGTTVNPDVVNRTGYVRLYIQDVSTGNTYYSEVTVSSSASLNLSKSHSLSSMTDGSLVRVWVEIEANIDVTTYSSGGTDTSRLRVSEVVIRTTT